jgi:hypothetical protein
LDVRVEAVNAKFDLSARPIKSVKGMQAWRLIRKNLILPSYREDFVGNAGYLKKFMSQARISGSELKLCGADLFLKRFRKWTIVHSSKKDLSHEFAT